MLTFISEIRIINLVFAIQTNSDVVLVTELEIYIFNFAIHGTDTRKKLQF